MTAQAGRKRKLLEHTRTLQLGAAHNPKGVFIKAQSRWYNVKSQTRLIYPIKLAGV